MRILPLPQMLQLSPCESAANFIRIVAAGQTLSKGRISATIQYFPASGESQGVRVARIVGTRIISHRIGKSPYHQAKRTLRNMFFSQEFYVGWGTLTLINAGLAQAKNRSGLAWFVISCFIGPAATFILVAFMEKLPDRRQY